MQDRVRFVEEMHPGRSTYNAPSAHRFGGPLDVAKFEAAVRAIIRRQPTLRTAIGPDPQTGAPAALIAQQLDYTLPVVDLGGLGTDEREAALAARMRELADRAIDIRRAPLFHATLFRMAADDHVFVFVPHHLIWDGWSFDILQNELSAVYGALVKGEPDALPALEVTHGDYAEWFSRWLETPECEAQLKFWKDRLANSPAPKAPRTDMPRRAGMSGQGSSHWIRVDLELTERLRELSRRHDVTLNMLTLGVFILMMGNIVRSNSIVIATPVRVREAPELESVMGFFNNLLPLSFQIDPSLGFGDFMRYVKTGAAGSHGRPADPVRAPGHRARVRRAGPGRGPLPGAVLVPGCARAIADHGRPGRSPAAPDAERCHRRPRPLADGKSPAGLEAR